MLGRATILLLISQGVLMVSGYAINVGLARLLGPADYGTFGVVMSFLLVVQLFVITGIPIALQKYVAENIDASRLLLRRTLPWHLIYSVIVFALFWLSAPFVANMLRDPSLAFYLQIASIDIIFYGLYKYYISMQNGLHQFGRQTISGVAYAIAKLVSIFALILLGYGVMGAIIGNMLGSVGGFLISLTIIHFPEVKGKLDEIPFFKFAFTNVFYFVGLQLLFSIDIWFVKYFLDDARVGQYVSAASIAKIPYFLSLAISSALLPSISRATKASDEKRVREIVRLSLRYWLILLFAMIVVVASTSSSLIVLFFGNEYAAGGPVLAVLFSAVALLTFAAVMNTILISRNKLLPCLVIVGLLIITHVSANWVLVPQYQGVGAANATLIVSVAAIFMSGILLLRETRVVMPPISVIRTIAAGAVVFILALNVSFLDKYVLLKCTTLLSLFIVALILFRELSLNDLKRLKTIVAPTVN